ncbi:TVP38/TMEM64 family protein [Sulfoacidibacillus thermotolerans]|uniref:TVP38/TMEM64 family membrane protein n=1 Tax=Sulfoacidibacillus thermotolerans TaxID=1765684 RepID=A0A2U3D7A3_SULT2|nr:TVP38/TMEM64 family protein [Sulfoacidibacillus thermotolerans]PWI57159.1 hypothetical protein BM613_09815 [Sulfoacidibacillus thermotolerans]
MRRWAAIKPDGADERERPFELKPIPVLTGVLLLAGVGWLYFHYRHSLSIHHALVVIQSAGMYGILVAVLLMAILCVLPVPSEFLIVANMIIYGVGWGLFYSWVGAVIGAVLAMYLTRFFGQPVVRRLLPEKRQQQVNDWVTQRGTLGLFALRFVPFVPFHALNYIAGLLDIELWPFVWTTALGIIPFDLVMGALFMGVSHGAVIWVLWASVPFAILFILGVIYRKKWFVSVTGTAAIENTSNSDHSTEP